MRNYGKFLLYRCNRHLSPANRYLITTAVSFIPNENHNGLQTGAASDRLGLGQGPDVPFAGEGRARGSASARVSSDDEKVRDHVVAVSVHFHLLT